MSLIDELQRAQEAILEAHAVLMQAMRSAPPAQLLSLDHATETLRRAIVEVGDAKAALLNIERSKVQVH